MFGLINRSCRISLLVRMSDFSPNHRPADIATGNFLLTRLRTAGRNVVPAVRAVIHGMKEQTLVRRVEAEVT